MEGKRGEGEEKGGLGEEGGKGGLKEGGAYWKTRGEKRGVWGGKGVAHISVSCLSHMLVCVVQLNRRLSFPAFHRADILDNALRVVIDTAK